LRVHQIINDYSLSTGGAQRIVRTLHECLPNKGVESFILGISKHDDDQLKGAQSLRLNSPYQFKAIKNIADYTTKYVKPGDIIHAHLFPVLLYMSMLKISGKLKNPLIFTEHNTSNRRRDSIVGKLIDHFTYVGCDKVVTISQGTQDSLLKWKPSLTPKVCTINNGVELYFTNYTARPKKEKIKIVSVGRLTEQKNYETALKSISMISNYNFEYYIAGDGKNLRMLKNLSKKLEIEDKVKFMGYVSDIPDLLKEADIFLMPSLWEGFGLGVVEAMNAGLPVVASDIPGLREVVTSHALCAELVDPKSPLSIANGLKKLIESPELRKTFGINGFERAKHFGLDKMIDGCIKIYSEISDSEFN
jgi:glycosyltransferase involved in cell wall biosynthesis